MEAKKIFCLEDKVMRLPGLYLMWTILFVANFVSLLADDSQGPVRDFNLLSNAASIIYCSLASVNTIYGNKLPSTMLLIAGPVHQYLHWLLFAYYGGSAVLSSTAVGVMNWVSLFVVGIFSLDMIFKTWLITCKTDFYTDYVKEEQQGSSKEEQQGSDNI